MGNLGEIFAEEKKKEVTDTPEKNKSGQIAAPVSKFEDSPIFSFYDALSPIKPVKSAHITQSINFASLPSVVFNSPQLNIQSHQLSDPSKPEFSLDTIDTDPVKDEQNDQSALDADVAENFNYDFTSPDSNLRTTVCNSSTFAEEPPQIDQIKEAPPSCDWESLMGDASGMLIFDSPNVDSFKKPIDQGTSFYGTMGNGAENVQLNGDGKGQENLSTQPGDENATMENVEINEMINSYPIEDPNEEMDFELSGLSRGMRRRCLDFEMAGAHTKLPEHTLTPISSSTLSQFNCNNSSNDHHHHQIAPTNIGNISSSTLSQFNCNTSSNDHHHHQIAPTENSSTISILPIGLHLNALTATPKDYRIGPHENTSSGRLSIGPISTVDFRSQATNQERVNNCAALVLSESGNNISVENGVFSTEDSSFIIENEEMNQSSPKKRKRKVEHTGEVGTCKRCNCKKSKCLKLYCECFAAGVYCVEPCACIDCFNKPIHEETVLATRKQIESRNPIAFTPKVIRGTDSSSEIKDDSNNTPASARHKRGCNCKKSGCLKKYCECFQGGVGCSINCRCEGCKNAFGRKDGMESEFVEEETDMTDKILVDATFQKPAIRNDLEQNTISVPPVTPFGRQSLHHPFSSNPKPPRFSYPCIGSSSSSGLYSTQGLGKSSFFTQTQPKFDNHLETVKENEIPDFLQAGSPVRVGIQTSSPNRKRVSPPHGVGMRSSRKLILQSVSSFPSLTNNQ